MWRVVGLLLLASFALADPVTDAADAVLAAKDLKALAARNDPDPWLVADELCRRGEFDKALAFAKAAPRNNIEELPAYVETRKVQPTSAKVRKALAAVDNALLAKDYKAALTALGAVEPAAPSVASIRLLHARGTALRSLWQLPASAEAFAKAGAAAHELGWLQQAVLGYHEAGATASRVADWDSAIRSFETRIAIEEKRGDRRGVARTQANIGMIHYMRKRYAEALDAQQRALAVMREIGNRRGIADMLTNIGAIHRAEGRYPAALEALSGALELHEELKNRDRVAWTLINISDVHEAVGDREKELGVLLRAFEAVEDGHHPIALREVLLNLSAVQLALGLHAEAIKSLERRLEVMRTLNDRAGIAMTLHGIGEVQHAERRFGDALESWKKALEIMQVLGDRKGVATALGNIGACYQSLGKYDAALKAHERALQMKQELGDRAGVAESLANIGRLHGTRGRYDEALKFHQRALKIRQELGGRPGIATALVDIGQSLNGLGQYARAQQVLERALEGSRKAENRLGVAQALVAIGSAHDGLGRYKKALEFERRALAMFQDIGDRFAIARTLSNIGHTHHGRGEFAEALKYQRRALAMSEVIGDHTGLVRALHNIGVVHHERGEYDEALESYERELKMSREFGLRRNVAFALSALGSVYGSRGDKAKALEFLGRGLELAEELGERRGVAGALDGLGRVHQSMGQYDKALECLQRSLDLARDAGDRVREASAIDGIGSIQSDRGQFAAALESYRRGLEVSRSIGDRFGIARALGSIGGTHRRIGEFAKALDAVRQALDISREIGDRPGQAMAVGAMGNIHESAGQYGRALELHQRSLRMKEEIGDRRGIATTLGAVGSVLQYLGQYEKALEFQQRALGMRRELGNLAPIANILGDIGNTYMQMGEHAKALEFQLEALELKQKLGIRAGVALTLGNIGLVRHSLRQYPEAMEAQSRALEIGEEIGDRALVARTHGRIGGTLMAMGNYTDAKDRYTRALALAREVGAADGTHVWAVRLGWLLLTRLGRPTDSVSYFEQAITIVETQRDDTHGLAEAVRAGYYQWLRSDNPYGGLAEAQLKLGKPGAALEAVERGRAREVLDLLARSRVDALTEADRRARERGDEKQMAAITEARAAVTDAERNVRRYTHALSVKQVPAARAELQKQLKQARARHTEAIGRRAILTRDLVPLAKPASVASIQQTLERKHRVLFYTVGPVGTLLFVVPPAGGKVTVHQLKWPDGKPVRRAELETAVRSYVAAMSNSDDAARGMAAATRETAGEASVGDRLAAALLPTVVREQLEDVDCIHLVPDGVLHKLPFEALRGGGLPPIAYTRSGSVLLWCQQRRSAQRTGNQRFEVVALGDPIFSRRKTDAKPPEKGVLVVAGRGQLDAGDVLLAYDGKPLADAKALRTEVRRVEDEAEDGGNSEIKLRVWRAGAKLDLVVSSGSLGIEVAREAPREAWPKLLEQSLVTLQRGASVDRFGDLARLPGTRREVESIHKSLGKDKVAVLLGEAATKGALFRLAPQGRFLHLATHQLVDETENRGYSRLALTRPRVATPGDDGFLSLFELFEDWRDRLSACELVVLSACETLKGPMQQDEGPYAMPLGFLYAGAPAVIGSLWRVDDASTAELFADFYARLAKGTPKLQAFTEARKALKKKYPDPYHWAAFVYIGDPR